MFSFLKKQDLLVCWSKTITVRRSQTKENVTALSVNLVYLYMLQSNRHPVMELFTAVKFETVKQIGEM